MKTLAVISTAAVLLTSGCRATKTQQQDLLHRPDPVYQAARQAIYGEMVKKIMVGVQQAPTR